jgi:hypothetical protein
MYDVGDEENAKCKCEDWGIKDNSDIIIFAILNILIHIKNLIR